MSNNKAPRIIGLALAGLLLGGGIGFALRPSIMGVQVPFEVAITRGAVVAYDLGRAIFGGLIDQSFFYIISGTLLGAITGRMVATLLGGRPGQRSAAS